MNISEALKEIGKSMPCPHDCVDQRLGAGNWVRCDDCGDMFSSGSIERLRESHNRWMQAMQVIEDAIRHNTLAEVAENVHMQGMASSDGRKAIVDDDLIQALGDALSDECYRTIALSRAHLDEGENE